MVEHRIYFDKYFYEKGGEIHLVTFPACPRPLRFVMDKTIFSLWYLSCFFKALVCIAIESSAFVKRSLRITASILDKGEVVALFPEEAISRNALDWLGTSHAGRLTA